MRNNNGTQLPLSTRLHAIAAHDYGMRNKIWPLAQARNHNALQFLLHAQRQHDRSISAVLQEHVHLVVAGLACPVLHDVGEFAEVANNAPQLATSNVSWGATDGNGVRQCSRCRKPQGRARSQGWLCAG